jgi:hypothetical protein
MTFAELVRLLVALVLPSTPSPDDFSAWRQQLGIWANERRAEIVSATWTGERE